MKVLILSQWYPPEPAVIPHGLATELVERGHEVLSVTGFPNYPLGRIYAGYHQRLWKWDELGGVRVLRLPLYPDHSRSGVRRALNFLSFAASASLLGPILSEPADVMWVYHPPPTIGLPAWWISALRRIPFVYEIQDMWPETLLATGMMRSQLGLAAIGRLARFAYNRATAITVISPGFKRNLIGKGVPEKKIHVIPNWADEDLYRPVPPDSALAAKHGLAGKFNVVYAGNIGLAQGLDTAVEAAKQLGDLPRVQFVLVGDGVDEPRLRAMSVREGVRNVRFLGRQPPESMSSFLALADAALVHLKRDPLFEMTIPSKTLAYMACARPILMAVAGDAADVVREAGAGLTCAPEEPKALAEAVRALYEMPIAARERMGNAGREAFLRCYTRRALVDQYEDLFRQVVRSHSCRRRNPSVGGGRD